MSRIINKNLKSFLSDSVIYTGVNLFSKAIPFLLLPIIISRVTPEDYGIYALFLTTEALLIPFIGLNLHGSLTRHYFEKDRIDFSSYLFSIIAFQLIIALGLLALISVFPKSIFPFIGFSKATVLMLVASAAASALLNIVTSLYRVKREAFKYGVFLTLKTIIMFGLIVVFILKEPTFEMLVSGRVLANILFFVVGAIIIYYIIRKANFKFKKKLLTYALSYSLPLIPHTISAFVFVLADRYLIEYFMDLESVGFYSAIFQASALASVLAMSFNSAWIPWLFENLKKEKEDVNLFIVKVSYMAMGGFILLGLCYSFMFPFICDIMLTDAYLTFKDIGYLFIVGFVFQGMYMVINPYISYVEKNKYQSYISFFSGLINVFLNLLLIPKYGLIGAAFSTGAAWILLFVLSFYKSAKLYKMPWLYWIKY